MLTQLLRNVPISPSVYTKDILYTRHLNACITVRYEKTKAQLNRGGVDAALFGGLGLGGYGDQRFAHDIDLLMKCKYHG